MSLNTNLCFLLANDKFDYIKDQAFYLEWFNMNR